MPQGGHFELSQIISPLNGPTASSVTMMADGEVILGLQITPPPPGEVSKEHRSPDPANMIGKNDNNVSFTSSITVAEGSELKISKKRRRAVRRRRGQTAIRLYRSTPSPTMPLRLSLCPKTLPNQSRNRTTRNALSFYAHTLLTTSSKLGQKTDLI